MCPIVWQALSGWWGYTPGGDQGGIIGGLEHLFLSGIDVNSVSGSIPTYVFVLFQLTFAGITVALVLGSVVDRRNFHHVLCLPCSGLTFIYCPIAHWVWGGGWAKWGF
ncbi:MAG: hypothetical protein R2860_09215 [Desulfobacterales bacterium]